MDKSIGWIAICPEEEIDCAVVVIDGVRMPDFTPPEFGRIASRNMRLDRSSTFALNKPMCIPRTFAPVFEPRIDNAPLEKLRNEQQQRAKSEKLRRAAQRTANKRK